MTLTSASKEKTGARARKIWIDLDNSPHVPFFAPIIRELGANGFTMMITARDCFQVCGLATLYQLPFQRIGVHYGKNKLMKAVGLVIRSAQLAPAVLRGKPDLALSHGSRSQLLLTAFLKIPSILIMDYEFSQKIAAPEWLIMPEVIPSPLFHFDPRRIIRYPGIKEDVYVPEFKPDPSIRSRLGLNPGDVIATVRPPATEAHYHNPESEVLFSEVIRFLGERDGVTMVVLPRNTRQDTEIRSAWPDYIRSRKILIPDEVVNGLNLIWHSDLVISGGGTINREAAALGVPVYSIFRGKLGAIDDYLSRAGRLRLVRSIQEIRGDIAIVPRKSAPFSGKEHPAALARIVETITKIAEGTYSYEGDGGLQNSGQV